MTQILPTIKPRFIPFDVDRGLRPLAAFVTFATHLRQSIVAFIDNMAGQAGSIQRLWHGAGGERRDLGMLVTRRRSGMVRAV